MGTSGEAFRDWGRRPQRLLSTAREDLQLDSSNQTEKASSKHTVSRTRASMAAIQSPVKSELNKKVRDESPSSEASKDQHHNVRNGRVEDGGRHEGGSVNNA
ncbi:hypothetical protein F5B21DRAFT_112753 [Xylaria acuta]|nr:hypothetical protein F5B21DRAFT_112753 [Xylaria acuta]